MRGGKRPFNYERWKETDNTRKMYKKKQQTGTGINLIHMKLCVAEQDETV